MSNTKRTIYYYARMRAAQDASFFSNRERACTAVYTSPESLADYENGISIPPCEVVQQMVDAYGDHGLRGEHIRAHCPLLTDYASEENHLAQAALGWVTAFQAAQDVALQFAEIARDGKVTVDEVDTVKQVRARALSVKKVMEESITAIDNALSRLDRGRRT